MHKLARLLERLGQSSKVNQLYFDEARRGWYNRYQRLSETLRDEFAEPDENEREMNEYISYHAFAANLHECSIYPASPTFAIWALRKALEMKHEEGRMRDTHVLAAAQWILWNGQSLFMQVRYPGDVGPDDKQNWSPGDLYDGEPLPTLHRWRFWSTRFREFAQQVHAVSDECKTVAAKAADMMDSIERNMTF
ncbi:hypothetical protein AJ79_02907 [Helicocarpus griseus UAMH5409]|uniref:Transcription factor domain-containing protein n=1 Tax=Helicocarpus griseus UAMH5409 TaxID=1447875 RepID=A0A2B7Y127_9EURO|nr:hypothetical protein AJ79_02907 [Helicocarpus griseus UAMH5409]